MRRETDPEHVDGGGNDARDTPVGDADHDTEAPEPANPSLCGNNVLDTGEECDDGNRIDGDGCDWLCRLGDGESLPVPDDDVPDYSAPGGDDVIGESPGALCSSRHGPVPMAWTGEVLAMALFDGEHDDRSTHRVTFRRFDGELRPLGPDWVLFLPGGVSPCVADIVWTGRGFGFFYLDSPEGIYFIPLDENAKPLAEPTLVIEGHDRATGVAADWDGERFAVTWSLVTDVYGPGCAVPEELIHETWLAGVDVSGAEAVAVDHILIDGTSSRRKPPDVAAGPEGVGVAYVRAATLEQPWCNARFVTVDRDGGEIRRSGSLSIATEAQVRYSDDEYVVAWPHSAIRRDAGVDVALCLARFDDRGTLAAPPVCDADVDVSRVRRFDFAATSDHHAALVTSFDNFMLFVVLDRNGRITGEPTRIPSRGLMNGVERAGPGFVAVCGGMGDEPLYLQHYVPEP